MKPIEINCECGEKHTVENRHCERPKGQDWSFSAPCGRWVELTQLQCYLLGLPR